MKKTSLEYFCPECHSWLTRSQIRERFYTDYQEQLCKVCDHEVYHEFDQRAPNKNEDNDGK